MGWMFFALYVSNLPIALPNSIEVNSYVDDTTLLALATNKIEVENKSNLSLELAKEWFNSNKSLVSLNLTGLSLQASFST